MPRQRRQNSQQFTKKKQKCYRHNGNNNNDTASNSGGIVSTTSIEDDLKQQRIRQQERRQKQQQQQEEEQEAVKGRRRRRDCEQGYYDGGDNISEDGNNDTADVAAVLPNDQPNNLSLISMLIGNNYSNTVGRIPSQLMGYMQQVNNVRPITTTTNTNNDNNNNTMLQQELVQYHHNNRRYGRLPLSVRLRDRQYCSYVMENMMINSKAASTIFFDNDNNNDNKTKMKMKKKKWYTHSLSDGRVTNTMFTCKDRLHPQARTFDVAFPHDDGHGGVSNGGGSSSSNHMTTPTISTIVQGGWGVFQPRYNNTGGGFSTIRCPPVHAIRMHESSGRMGTILRPSSSSHYRNNSNMPYQFHIYPLPQHVTTTHLEATLPQPANDFCFGKDIALFACPHIRSTGVLLPIFLHLEHGNTNTNSPFRKLDVRNFPQSDALRVEMKCSENDKFIAFGHRNGQVSLIDLRAPRAVSSILHCELSAATGNEGASTGPLGSVSDLAFLGDHGMDDKFLLVKRSFGSCQLHDLRMSSSVSPYSSETAGRPHPRGLLSSLSSSQTLVQNFSLPSDQINPTLSLNCNGFAVDRIGHTVFSPYIHSNGDACLGLWSLRTGTMVGSRVLISGGGSSDSDEDVMFVEMSQRLTPYYDAKKRGTYESRCGMWLKCGAFTNTTNISSKAGDLYHISIPGRYSP